MMKKLIVAAMLIATLGISSVAYAQGNRPTQSRQSGPGGKGRPRKSTDGKVTAVKLTGRETSGTTACRTYIVNGVITTDGPAEVKYKWVDDPTTGQPEKTLKFLRGGYKKVSFSWTKGRWRSTEPANGELSLQLKSLSPNEVLSNKVKLTGICR